MILAAKRDIELFQVTISHTVSLAAHLASEHLNEDNFTNRVVAISYFLTKNLDMKDEKTLADIVCAAFFCHLGITQTDHSLCHKPQIEYNENELKKHKKHPGYSHHLLMKSGVQISDRCKNIIFTHHERFDGSGYPNQKHSDFIDILALCLGAVTHLLEYSSGKITGSPLPLDSVIIRLKNKTFSTGLEFEFGDFLQSLFHSIGCLRGHAGHLHQNAVIALRQNQKVAGAVGVKTVLDSADRLLHRVGAQWYVFAIGIFAGLHPQGE